MIGISDASKEESGRIGMGGIWWRRKKDRKRWSKSLGWGWTVTEGEVWGVGELMERIEREYEGGKKKMVLGTDNKGVLDRLRKGRGMCREAERRIRRVGKRLISKG